MSLHTNEIESVADNTSWAPLLGRTVNELSGPKWGAPKWGAADAALGKTSETVISLVGLCREIAFAHQPDNHCNFAR